MSSNVNVDDASAASLTVKEVPTSRKFSFNGNANARQWFSAKQAFTSDPN